MIVPRFWAEARLRQKVAERQVTIRRFGWSNVSQADAQSNADLRAEEALSRHLRGELVKLRDLKRAYNGSEGVPIREEIIHEIGETVITRNSYGALCLNTPNILFVDIDFDQQPSWWQVGVSMLVTTCALFAFGLQLHRGLAVALALAGPILGYLAAVGFSNLVLLLQGGSERRALWQIEQFIAHHPHWHVRVYRTPAGLRVLTIHSKFDPSAPEVTECFRALHADPIYAQMCLRQQCFRARVSPKPWRIGIGERMKPGSVWPIDADRLPDRAAWVRKYEEAAQQFASCQFVTEFGSGQIDPAAAEVQQLHDEFCQIDKLLPIA